MSDLSGRDPETRAVDEALIPAAYDKLEAALMEIVRKFNFENFLMTIKSAGFISPKMIGLEEAAEGAA